MKKFLSVIILSLVTTLIYAQSSGTSIYQDSLKQYSGGGFDSHKYTIGGKQITKNEAYAKLISYQQSAIEFNQYKKYNNLTIYTLGAVLTSLVASFIVNGPQSTTFNNTSSKVLLGIGVGLLIPEAIFAGQRNKHRKQSIKLYNQQFNKAS